MVLLNVDSHVSCLDSSWSYTFLLLFPKWLIGVNAYWHIFTWSNWLGYLEWKGSYWKHITVASIVAKLVSVVVSFMVLPCLYFSLEFVAAVSAVVREIALEVGSSTGEACSLVLHVFDLCNTWSVWGTEFSSAIALSLFISGTNIMNIPETLIHHFPFHVPVFHRQKLTCMLQVHAKELIQTLFQLDKSLGCMPIR